LQPVSWNHQQNGTAPVSAVGVPFERHVGSPSAPRFRFTSPLTTLVPNLSKSGCPIPGVVVPE
jgi:hypothetical protein